MSQPRDDRQDDLFRSSLEQIINLRHPLVRLAAEINWDFLAKRFSSVCRVGPGQPPLPTRLVAGLFILKHMHNLSDEALCDRWVENPYFQYFCGEVVFRHELPFDRSSLTRWRQRLGEEQIAALLQESLSVAHRSGGDPDQRSRAGRGGYHRAGESDRASDRRPAHPSRDREAGRSGQTRGCRAAPELSAGGKARRHHGRGVIRMPISSSAPGGNLSSCIPGSAASSATSAAESRATQRSKTASAHYSICASRIRHQEQRQRGPKVYSLHAPEVECIGKGKVPCPLRVRLQGVDRTHQLPRQRRAVRAACQSPAWQPVRRPYARSRHRRSRKAYRGCRPRQSTATKGYRGHTYPDRFKVWISGQIRRVTKAHPSRDAPSRRRRTRDRPSQGRSSDASQLSQRPRWRPHQRRARRRRLPLQPAAARGSRSFCVSCY